MSTAEAQSTPSEPAATPLCEFCGKALVLDPTRVECCHQQAAVHHTLQLDSARNVSRHVIYLRKQVGALETRITELENLIDRLTAPKPMPAKAKG